MSYFFILSSTENSSIIPKLKQTDKEIYLISKWKQDEENYFLRLERQKPHLAVEMLVNKRLVHKDAVPLFSPASRSIDLEDVVAMSKPGTNTPAICRGGRGAPSKAPTENASSQRNAFPSLVIPTAQNQGLTEEQTGLHPLAQLLGIPNPTASLSPLPPLWSRLSPSWTGRDPITHFNHIKSLMCHHQQGEELWASESAVFREAGRS